MRRERLAERPEHDCYAGSMHKCQSAPGEHATSLDSALLAGKAILKPIHRLHTARVALPVPVLAL